MSDLSLDPSPSPGEGKRGARIGSGVFYTPDPNLFLWYYLFMSFQNTIGHEKQKQLFLRAAKFGRLAHAYALVGPRHVGKTTFALDFAQNCLGVNMNLDLLVFDEEEGIGIEQARMMRSRLFLTSFKNSPKLAVITSAEKMTPEAGNALLKTLEEPPTGAMIILVTENFYGLLPTIASRLQVVHFGRVANELVTRELDKFQLSEDLLLEIVGFAQGRLGLALRLAQDQGLLDLFRKAKSYWAVLRGGNLIERFKASEALAELEHLELERFLKLTTEFWTAEVPSGRLAKKLRLAWRDLNFNLNTRLLLDNLFLP